MADPNKDVPSHHDPVLSDVSLDINIEFSDDPPSGENIMLDEDVTQLVHARKNTMLNEDINQFGHGTSQAGPSGGVNDQSNEHLSGGFNPDMSNFGNPIRLLQWPALAEPYTCSCCQVLREIIHTIDGETRKFEIHGRLGEIFHGILEICRRDVTAPNTEYQMFDFCKESIPDVKVFLVQYCEERADAGYTMVKDPLLAFNDALNVGSDWEYGLGAYENLHGSPIHTDEDSWQQSEESDVSQPQASPNKKRSKGKGKKARVHKKQRVSKELEVKDLADYFHLSMSDAAKEVGIHPSALRAICSKANFSWPYKKIKKLKKQKEDKQKILNSSANARERAIAEAEIKQLEQEIASFAAPYKNN